MLTAILCFSSLSNFAQSLSEIASSIGISDGCTGIYGNGVSFYDWDSDGFDDIVLLDDNYSVRFYKNTNGLFQVVEMPGIQVNGAVKSVNWVDINNDNEPDITFNLAPGTFKVFLNNGGFNFTDISATCGIEQIESMGYAQNWGDYDKDGFLDLYISNYQTEVVFPQRTNYLYHNNGDGTFTNTTEFAGVGNGLQYTLISVWMDFDKDTWPDLFVLNDRMPYRNYLYKNNGDGTFTDISEMAGFAEFYEPMSASVGDFNNDEFLDIYSTHSMGNRLYQNNAGTSFSEVAAVNNVQMFINSWGAIWMDIDGDKDEDLVVAVDEYSTNYNNIYLLMNTGTGFETAQNYGFIESHGNSFSIASGDINNDGKQEIINHAKNPAGTQLWTTNNFNYNYLKINLNGIYSNSEGTGSWIQAYVNGVVQTRYTLSGEQYLSQNSQWEFFGFGNNEVIDSLVVHWPSGIIDRYTEVSTNQALVLQEGETTIFELTINGSLNPCLGDTVILDAGEWDSYIWQDGSTERYFSAVNSGEFFVVVNNGIMDISYQQINLHFASLNDYYIYSEEPLCYESGNGIVKIIDLNSTVVENVMWNESIISSQFSAAPDTIIHFSFTDISGCEFSGETIIGQPGQLSLEINSFWNDDLGSCPNSWEGYVEVEEGVLPYQIDWTFFTGTSQIPFEQQSGQYFNCIENSANIRVNCKVTDGNGCIKESESMLVVQSVNSTNEFENNLMVYPNPFNSFVVLNNLKSESQLSVYDLTGKTMKFYTISENDTIIDLSTLPSGLYTLEIIQETSITHNKIVKK